MKKLLLFILSVMIAFSATAAPAYRKPFKVKQSDGTVLTVMLKGDEALHYHSTLDGKPLVKEVNGDFCYATFSNEGAFVSTKMLAHDAEVRNMAEKSMLSAIDYSAMSSSIEKAAKARSVTYKAAAQKAGSQIKPEGEVNVAVVLVQFKDCKFSYTKDDFNNLLNTEGFIYKNPIVDGVGSLRDYFIAQSDGKFRPNFLVTDIVTLDNAMSYYGANDNNDEDLRPTYMVKEGIAKADATFDFSKCDNNGDGEVEFVYCIYAGYSEASGADENTIWPHQWVLSAESGSIKVDGVKCDTYACSGELVYNESYESEIGKVLAGIGLICHEFSHCLGLHDIYDTTYESGNFGMDFWDVMDYGNYTAEGYVPVGYSAYQRDFCGWRELVELNEKGSYSMEALTRGGVGYKIVNDANPDEYYILENRKAENWDRYIFGEGMLIVHVDYLKSAWNNNTINATKGHPRYTLIPADGKLLAYDGDNAQNFIASLQGDVWPGTSGNTKLTNSSTPAAKVYTGGYMNKPITNIKYENDVISFDFMEGFLGTPQLLPASQVAATSFVANWNKVDGAKEYVVELYKVSEASGGAGNAVALLEENFTGCVAENLNITNSFSQYVEGDWIADNVYSDGGVLRIGTSNDPGFLITPYIMAEGEVVVSFKTWLYNSSDKGVVFGVGLYDESDEEIAYEELLPTSQNTTYKVKATIDGVFYVVFDTYSSTGKNRVKLDDVVVSATSSTNTEKIAAVTVSGTSYKFDGLDAGCRYIYRVQAKDASGSSAFSEYAEVVLLETSIDNVVIEEGVVEVFTLAGVKVYAGDAVSMPKLEKGVYLLVTPSATRKIVVR